MKLVGELLFSSELLKKWKLCSSGRKQTSGEAHHQKRGAFVLQTRKLLLCNFLSTFIANILKSGCILYVLQECIFGDFVFFITFYLSWLNLPWLWTNVKQTLCFSPFKGCEPFWNSDLTLVHLAFKITLLGPHLNCQTLQWCDILTRKCSLNNLSNLRERAFRNQMKPHQPNQMLRTNNGSIRACG